MAKIFPEGMVAGVLAFGLVTAVATSAAADAEVSVELRDAEGKPAEGDVSLVDAKGATRASCTTRGGKCEMTGVPGGSYTVKVAPKKGAPPKPRKVMIPPAGKVSLIVSASSK